MADRLERIQNSNNVGNIIQQSSNDALYGYVTDVVLDDTHKIVKETKYGTSAIGAILFKSFGGMISNSNIAFPFDKNLKELPTRNEKVELHRVVSMDDSKKKGQFFYRRIGIESTQNYNASGVEISTNFKEQQQSQQKTAANYSNTLETDIPESNQKNPDEFNGKNPTHCRWVILKLP